MAMTKKITVRMPDEEHDLVQAAAKAVVAEVGGGFTETDAIRLGLVQWAKKCIAPTDRPPANRAAKLSRAMRHTFT